jgi:hypothetical protein
MTTGLRRITKVSAPDLTINSHMEDLDKILEGKRFDIVIGRGGKRGYH